jgi:hypothetical protein
VACFPDHPRREDRLRGQRRSRGHGDPDPDRHQHRPATDQDRPPRCRHRHHPIAAPGAAASGRVPVGLRARIGQRMLALHRHLVQLADRRTSQPLTDRLRPLTSPIGRHGCDNGVPGKHLVTLVLQAQVRTGGSARLAGLLPPDRAARALPVLTHTGLVVGSLSLASVRPCERRACHRLAVDSMTSLRLVTGRTCSDLAWSPL